MGLWSTLGSSGKQVSNSPRPTGKVGLIWLIYSLCRASANLITPSQGGAAKNSSSPQPLTAVQNP